MALEINMFDVVRLKDGREGTVIEVFSEDERLAYFIETPEDMSLWPIVSADEIAEVTYRAK